MKIGVAMSGCDIGGISAWRVLKELKEQGSEIGMISVSCVPSITALLYASGCDEAVMQRLSTDFLRDFRETDIDLAVANLSALFRPGDGAQTPLAVNAVNIPDGTAVTFTDDYALKSGNIRTFGIGDPYDMLSATISLMDGLGSYRYKDCQLCDFCCRYGCPIHPLRLAGMQKIVSITFLPENPKTPYEVLVKQMTASSAAAADVYIPIEFTNRESSFERYAEIATGKIKNCANQILLKTLF